MNIKNFESPATKILFLIIMILVLALGVWIGKSLKPPGSDYESKVTDSQHYTKLWTCSMHPEIKLPNPGQCPKCNMDLIPLETYTNGSNTSKTQLTVSENAKNLMDIEVAPVQRKFVEAVVRMTGKIDYDEKRLSNITARVPGRIDRLYVDYTGVKVNEGEHLVYLYSPELISAQEELLQSINAVKTTNDSELGIIREMTRSTVNAVRKKLRLWGLTPKQIEEIETTGKVADHVTIYSPASGIVIKKNVIEGMYVNTGTAIYSIADLSKVWVLIDAYESDLQWIRYGQKVEFTTVSYPGEIFYGTISFIDPILNEKTRTVKVRVNVDNAHAKLKPGMFAKALVRTNIAGDGKVTDSKLAGKWICSMHPEIIKNTAGTCDICQMPLVKTESMGYFATDTSDEQPPLVIPASAPLITGTRALVYIQMPDTNTPTYQPRQITLGPKAGQYYIVKSGLKENEMVVTKGNFKIDSSLQIMASPSMMSPQPEDSGNIQHHRIEHNH